MVPFQLHTRGKQNFKLSFNTKLTRRQVMIFRLPNRITTFKQRVYIPTNTIHQPDVVPMLVHRLRRWPNIGLIYRVCCPLTSQQTRYINPMLVQCWSTVYDVGPTLGWYIVFVVHWHPSKHDTSTQCWSNVSPCLRRWPNIGPTLSSWNVFKKTLVMDDYFLCSMRLLFGRFQSRDEVG